MENEINVGKWLSKMDDAEKREKDWRRNAKDALEIYECNKPDQIPYNILYANTIILAPSIYSNTPSPVVKRRFDDEDLQAKQSSEIAKRTLEYLIDDNDPKYAAFDDLMKCAVAEGLIVGRGSTRFKYDAELIKDSEGNEIDVKYEIICGEEIPWDRLLHGYAKQWCDVPWIAIIHYKTREELEKMGVSKEDLKDISFEFTQEAMKTENYGKNVSSDDSVELAKVYEIWDKLSKKVILIASNFKDKELKVDDDPLELAGFYPIPEPIGFFKRLSGLTPQILYLTYKNQAQELNRITTRINKIVDALKVRGFYDGSVQKLDTLMAAEDNTLIAAENVMKFEGKTLDNIIWFMPLNDLVGVLNQLYQNREQVKSIIFELTGIADIMRGSSAASETLGAQALKSQWGTMRLKDMQKEGARYARDCLRLMSELAMTKLSQETIKGMTNLKIPTEMEQAMANQQLQQLQQQENMLKQQAQMQQLPPEQVEGQVKELEAQAGKLQAILDQPSWESSLALLKSDITRQYRIDIETNSTIEVEASQDKQEVSEFMNAFAQFLNGVAPLVQSGQMPFEVAQTMMLAITRKFRFGTEVEEQLMKMTPPPAPQPDPKEAAMQAKLKMEEEMHKLDSQHKQQDQQLKEQVAQADLAIKQAQLNQEQTAGMLKAKQAQAEHDLKLLELAQKQDIQTRKFDLDMQNLEMKAAVQAKLNQDKLLETI